MQLSKIFSASTSNAIFWTKNLMEESFQFNPQRKRLSVSGFDEGKYPVIMSVIYLVLKEESERVGIAASILSWLSHL